MEPHIVSLPKIFDDRGNLSFMQQHDQVPFEIKRTFWVYDVPGGEERGSHAFRKTEMILVALSGSFDVRLHNGVSEQLFSLNRSYYALYIPRLCWRTLCNFSTNSFALALASTPYDEADYIRDFNEFCQAKNNAK